MYQNHTDAFICKDKQGKVTIGEIVNPAAYTTDFDVFKQPILITPLPCPSKGALFLSQIFGRNNLVSSHQLASTPQGPQNVLNNIQDYFDKTKNNGTICGIGLIHQSDPTIKKLLDDLHKFRMNHTGCFCRRTFTEILPVLGKLRTHCTVNPFEINFVFGLYYVDNQLYRKHSTPFSCKDKKGKELLGEIIQPAAYLPNYDLTKNPLLTRPLPFPSNTIEILLPMTERNNLVNLRPLDPTPEDLRNVLNNIIHYFNETKNNNTICGIGIAHQSDPTIKKLLDDFIKFARNYTGCFCRRTFIEILPTLCKLRTHCIVNPVEIDFAFGLYYIANQAFRKHLTPFSCKDKKGKELLGEIIQPAAYLPNYDLTKNPLLTRPLPCNNTIEEIECSATEEIGQIRSENDDDPIQLEVFKKLFEKFQH